MFERPHLQLLKERIKEPRRFIQVLFGPRQVGKTTIISQLSEQMDCHFVIASGDDVSDRSSVWVSAQWGKARAALLTSGGRDVVLVIDEIQKIDNFNFAV